MDPSLTKLYYSEKRPKQYKIRSKLLIHGEGNDEKFVLPHNLISYFVGRYHTSIFARHMAPSTMADIISKKFYYPNLIEALKSEIGYCPQCMTQKSHRQKLQTIGKKQIPTKSRKCWFFDIFGGLNPVQNKRYCFAYVCAFSGFTILVPSPSREATQIRDIFHNRVWSYYGGDEIYSDQEKSMDSELMIKYTTERNIRISHSAAYSAQSNGQVERVVDLLKELIRIYCAQRGKNWIDILGDVMYSLN